MRLGSANCGSCGAPAPSYNVTFVFLIFLLATLILAFAVTAIISL